MKMCLCTSGEVKAGDKSVSNLPGLKVMIRYVRPHMRQEISKEVLRTCIL